MRAFLFLHGETSFFIQPNWGWMKKMVSPYIRMLDSTTSAIAVEAAPIFRAMPQILLAVVFSVPICFRRHLRVHLRQVESVIMA